MSIARGAGAIYYETPCVECMSAVVYQAGTYARDFGAVYSKEGLIAYARDGVCEWCADYAADAAVMGKQADWMP